MKTREYRVKGITKEEKRSGHPVYLYLGKNCKKEIRMRRPGGGVTIPTVELTWIERLKFTMHKLDTTIKGGECMTLKLKRIK